MLVVMYTQLCTTRVLALVAWQPGLLYGPRPTQAALGVDTQKGAKVNAHKYSPPRVPSTCMHEPQVKIDNTPTSKTKGTRVTTAVVKSTQPVRPVFFAAHCAHPNPAVPSDLPVTSSP